MRRIISCLLASLFLLACTQELTIEPKKEKKKFDMYEMSEMASLMRQMHHVNGQLKERIERGEDLGSFPSSFERILEASMTDNKVMDDFFVTHAKEFLASQKRIYENPDQSKELFNEAVENCLACHQVKCTGPIPKIQQLLID